MLAGGNNTHSGNLSLRDPADRDVFLITASGSQCGALIPSDIVPVRFSRVSWGDGRASTESTIHRKILAMPGVEAAVHAHYPWAISVTFDSKAAGNHLLFEGERDGTEEFSFVPIDRTGAWVLGRVPSGTYVEPVGSKEMESRIPRYLAESRATLVKGHGPFVRGGSLPECLHLLGVVDSSAKLLQAARLRGVDTTAIARRIRGASPAAVFPLAVRPFDVAAFGVYETRDEATIRAFRERALFNFVQGVSPYATGSMSEKITEREMLYCPSARRPKGTNRHSPPGHRAGRRGRLGAGLSQVALPRIESQGVYDHAEPPGLSRGAGGARRAVRHRGARPSPNRSRSTTATGSIIRW